MTTSFLQVRTNEADKQQAGEILEQLGTNFSAVVNMLLKQIIITKSIPFKVELPVSYSLDEKIKEIEATLNLEGMDLLSADKENLKKYIQSDFSEREKMRQKLIQEYAE